jgi:hypothetical protein
VLGTLTEEQQQVCRLLPYPLASAWLEVLSAATPAQLQARLHIEIEVITRLLAVVALCDYLRGPVVDAVEAQIRRLDRPEPEDWLALIQAALEALAARRDPPVLMADMLVWRDRSTPAGPQGLALLGELVQRRREAITNVSIDAPHAPQAEALLVATAALLTSLRWLGAWRLLRVVDLTTLRHRGFAGHLQLFQGADDSPEPLAAAWTAHLVTDALYLTDPAGSQFLEVSPFLRILPHPRTRRPLCFLFDSSPLHHQLVLAHHASGVRVETSIAGPDGPMALGDWLGRRSAPAVA